MELCINPDFTLNTFLGKVTIPTKFLEDRRGVHTKKFAVAMQDGSEAVVSMILQIVYSLVGEGDTERVL